MQPGSFYQKLCRSFDPHSAAAAVAKMQELNLLDDAGFCPPPCGGAAASARAAVQFWMICTPKALTAARPPKRWKLCLPKSEEDEEENPELANARALVERHYAAKLAQGKWQQVAAALARRGFSHSVIRQALADAETEETEA